MLSLSYYLHERAEESRHNETMGLLTALLGSIFMVGGIILTLVTVERPQWFLVFPYQVGTSPYDFLGLAFTLMGVIIFFSGIILGVYFAAQRSWYSNALRDSYRSEEERLRANKEGQKVVSRTLPVSETGTRGEPSVADIREVERESTTAPTAAPS